MWSAILNAVALLTVQSLAVPHDNEEANQVLPSVKYTVEDIENNAEVGNTTVSVNSCNAEWCDPSHEPYPNIVAVMTGYNIIKGNPFTSGARSDPGFDTAYIFAAIIATDEKRYTLHGGVTVRQSVRCTLSSDTSVITTVEGYKHAIGNKASSGVSFSSNLETEVSAEVKGVGVKTTVPPIVDASFSSSETYNDNEDFFTKNRGVLTMNDAVCSTYTVHINSYDPPPFTKGFKKAIKKLNMATGKGDQAKIQQFREFIRQFGTHFIEQVTMGARLAISRRYTEREYKNSKAADVQECNSQRLNLFLGAKVGYNAEKCINIADSAVDATAEGKQREYVTTYGSKPAKSLDDWSLQDFNAPLPIKMRLSPILNLFTDAHMKKMKGVDYKNILRWIGPLYTTYCEDNQEELGVKSCHPQSNMGCGWNDECVPKIETCINRPNGHFCCKPKCLDSPCQNGGVCTDDLTTCDYTCECTEGYIGKSCTEKVVVTATLVQQIRNQMLVHKGKSHAEFANYLLTYLNNDYPRYYFVVNSYAQANGPGSHFVQGNFAHVFGEHGRNVIAGFVLKTSRFPSAAKKDEIRNAILSKITEKFRSALFCTMLAWNEAIKHGYRIALILNVRFGNGLRTRGANNKYSFFKNYVSEIECYTSWFKRKCDKHESSLVVMFGSS